jgi:hypothetical protein
MKLTKKLFTGFLFAASTIANANEIPDLQSSISELSASELSSFESSIGEVAITETLDVAVEVAIEAGPDEMPVGLVPELSTDLVSQALSEGFITETEAADLTTVVEIYTANEKYFDFNFAETLSQAVANNGLTASEAAFMLQSFDSLSEAGKNAVGQESFNFDANHADMTALSDADRRIICAVDCANNPF